MEKKQIKSKYILILLLSLFTILGMSMTTLADGTTTSGTSAGTSAGTSGYMSITPRISTNTEPGFVNIQLEMFYNGTSIAGTQQIDPANYGSISYKIINTKVAKVGASANYVQINNISVSYPSQLIISYPTPSTYGMSIGTVNTTTGAETHSVVFDIGTPSNSSGMVNQIETFMDSISFTLDSSQSYVYPPDTSAIEISSANDNATFRLETLPDGTTTAHVYERVADSTSTWLEAYNLAKARTNILISTTRPGYLATITSPEEQQLIYEKIATDCGWLGGTRLAYNGAKIIDDPNITANLPSTSASTIPGGYTGLDEWYWANGPEAGKIFYGSGVYTPSLGIDGGAVDINYNYFNASGNPYGPNTYNLNGVSTTFNPGLTSKEPNNNGNPTSVPLGEYCLQFAFPSGGVASPYWNDYDINVHGKIDAYYVEWGGYDSNDKLNGIKLEIPQPIVAQYQLKWNGGDAIAQTGFTHTDTIPLKNYYFFGQVEDRGNPTKILSGELKTSQMVDASNLPLNAVTGGTLQSNFEFYEMLEDGTTTTVPADTSPWKIKEVKQTITFVYWGIEMDLEYYSNNGVFPTGDPEGPITIKSRFMEPLEPLPATDHPTKHSSDLTDWTVNTNGSPDHFAETANIIEYQTTTPVSATVTRFTDASGKMQAYAVWTRNAWDLYFDGNGGQLNGVDTIQIPLVPGTRVANIDISTYLPDGVNQPTWFANAFLGWSNTGNIQNHGTESTPGTFTMTGDVYLKAEWLDLADYVNNYIKDTVIYKGESDAQSILRNSGLYPTYPDLLGNIHPIHLTIEPFYEATIEDGGVAEIRFSLNDPITGGPITLPKSFVDLYSLNRAYVKGGDTYYMFVGESAPMGAEFGVTGVAEFPDFSTRSISRQFFPLNYADGSVNANAKGMYDTDFDILFKDYFGDSYPMHWDAMVIVRERAELTKEEKLQVEASEFWVIVTDIYHKMQPGQIIEVNEYNFKDGGNLLTEKVSADAPYDRQIRVTPGPYIYMNPCILDRIKDDKAGSMDVYMPGRSLTFNSWEFETDPTVDGAKYDPRSYFNLRLHLESNEKVSALVPENTANMQFTLSMNRAWMAEPTFTVAVNDSLKAAAAEGKGLYLFNYNENTNELELVGAMSNSGNGNFSIKMNGAYGSYVILAGLPSNGKYRLTEQTNNLDEGTVQEVIINQQDSGKSVSNGQELNAISNTKTFLGEKSVELSTPMETKKESNLGLIIISLAIGMVVASGSVIIYKRKYN